MGDVCFNGQGAAKVDPSSAIQVQLHLQIICISRLIDCMCSMIDGQCSLRGGLTQRPPGNASHLIGGQNTFTR